MKCLRDPRECDTLRQDIERLRDWQRSAIGLLRTSYCTLRGMTVAACVDHNPECPRCQAHDLIGGEFGPDEDARQKISDYDTLCAEIERLRHALGTAAWALRQPLDGWKGECERKALDEIRPLIAAELLHEGSEL